MNSFDTLIDSMGRLHRPLGSGVVRFKDHIILQVKTSLGRKCLGGGCANAISPWCGIIKKKAEHFACNI